MSESRKWNIDIEGGSEICQWITDKGGPDALISTDITELIAMYLQGIGISSDISGCVAYFIAYSSTPPGQIYIDQGNQMTGCDF